MVVGQDLIRLYFTGSALPDSSQELFFTALDLQPLFCVKAFARAVADSDREKQVDVYIAVQMVALAYENAYDHAFLISGDLDYAPAIDIVQQKGKVVTVVSTSGCLSPELQRRSDRFVLIDRPGPLHYENFIQAK